MPRGTWKRICAGSGPTVPSSWGYSLLGVPERTQPCLAGVDNWLLACMPHTHRALSLLELAFLGLLGARRSPPASCLQLSGSGANKPHCFLRDPTFSPRSLMLSTPAMLNSVSSAHTMQECKLTHFTARYEKQSGEKLPSQGYVLRGNFCREQVCPRTACSRASFQHCSGGAAKRMDKTST